MEKIKTALMSLGILLLGAVVTAPGAVADEPATPIPGVPPEVVPSAWSAEKPHPQAPPETEQFGFLVGTWDCKAKFLQPDGSGYGEGRAIWRGRYILDGWAIQDDWIAPYGDGRYQYGTNIRSFNPRTNKWDNRWLPTGSLKWKYYEAEKKGDTMVMTGGEGKDARGEFIDRNTFHEITANSWKWRKDRSYDGGKTWKEGIGYIEAVRMPGPSPAKP